MSRRSLCRWINGRNVNTLKCKNITKIVIWLWSLDLVSYVDINRFLYKSKHLEITNTLIFTGILFLWYTISHIDTKKDAIDTNRICGHYGLYLAHTTSLYIKDLVMLWNRNVNTLKDKLKEKDWFWFWRVFFLCKEHTKSL